ncbi:MAG: tRNA uridine-5-carboxymethylaminomethyl(34) synthesis GTPase MnmE [Alphaproteobacteria bacterium]
MAALHESEETIFALASGVGRAGVAVVRLSGRACVDACRALSGKAPPPAREARLAVLHDPEDGEAIDQGLVLWFPGPASFTGEDVLELHVHGGPAVLTALFEALGNVREVRPAHPGEFSRRAFMNGKMDLTAAEGLADLVAAETRQQARQARRQMEGALGQLYGDWHGRLLDALALIEAEIDFAPEEEVPDDLLAGVLPKLHALQAEIGRHLADSHRGERLRSGLRVALIGPPNAGKSSLLNRLAARDVAIVTDIPGTTRDVLETPLDLGGYPVTLTDMAGLRKSDDPVERLGVERALTEAKEADIRLALFDGACWPAVDAETEALIDEATVVVLNKADLLDSERTYRIGGRDALLISCHSGSGVDRLIAELSARAARAMAPGDAPLLTRARHRRALVEVAEALERIEQMPPPAELALIAEDLRHAMQAMGRITGRVGVEDVLDQIFSTFCIGK